MNRSQMVRIACVLSAVMLLEGWATFGEQHVVLAHNSHNTTDHSLAAELQVFNIMQFDLDADGNPDQAVIQGAFITDDDLLTIYDSQNDMVVSNNWQEIIHFDHATLIFDAGADGLSELVIFFQREENRYTALLFDDRDGDGFVSYQVTGNVIDITELDAIDGEPVYPSVRVEADGPWLTTDGRAQANIRFSIDGFVPKQVSATYPEFLNYYFSNDGIVDFEVEVVDSNHDGNLDYELIRLVQPLSYVYQPFRTLIFKTETYNITEPPNGYLFWPFLNGTARYESTNYLDSPPTIDMDWETGQINRAGIWGYPTEAGWHMTSFFPLQKNQINDTSFETPMAYYDLAQNNDGLPELHVRVSYQALVGPGTSLTSYGVPNEEVRYSWKHDVGNGLTWNYKLGLFGRHTIDTVVSFPDFQIRTIPYAELPGWVVQNEWDAAMFIVPEETTFASSEGIYAGDLFSLPFRSYLLGETTQVPLITTSLVNPGWRGEYTWDLNSRPLLYFSSIDHELHLKGAERGFWRILQSDDIIEFESLGGEYLGKWSLIEGGRETRSLYHSDTSLIYYDAITQEFRIKIEQINPFLFETLPPTNHLEWQDLGQKLQENSSSLTPGDILALYDQFDSREMRISNATLRDYRRLLDGYRFILSLEPGFTITGPDWLGLQGQPSGQYAVEFTGAFQLQAFTPPQLNIEFADFPSNQQEPLTAYINAEIRVNILNQGLEDAKQVLVMLGASPVGGKIHWIAPQTVRVLAGEGTMVTFPWTPPEAGEWRLQVWLNILEPASTGGIAVSVEQPVSVRPAQGTTLQQEISAFGVIFPWQTLLLLLSFLGAAGLVGGVIARLLRQESAALSSESDHNTGETP